MLMNAAYTYTDVDMWSVGCIMAELLNRQPLITGVGSTEQLQVICKKIGLPGPSNSAAAGVSLTAKHILDHLKSKTHMAKGSSVSTAGSLLDALLMFKPESRITAAAALTHDYFEMYRATAPTVPVTPYEFVNAEQYSKPIVKRLLWNHTLTYYAAGKTRIGTPYQCLIPSSELSAGAESKVRVGSAHQCDIPSFELSASTSTVDNDDELSDMWEAQPATDGRETIVPSADWSEDECDM
eukprot:12777-Heterococcus_DN1.PRE.2